MALALGLGLLAFLPRLAAAVTPTITADEPRWMLRSEGFSDALTSFNPSDATAAPNGELATLPGVVTMWIGSLARVITAVGRPLGLTPANEGASDQFGHSAAALNVAQILAAVVTATLVGLLAGLVAAWVGRVAGGVVGLLLATEPFFVAHGALLHTDELFTLFGMASLVALAVALGLPRVTDTHVSSDPARHLRLAALAGALFAASWLSKLSAIVFIPSVVMLFGWFFAVRWRCASAAKTEQAWRTALTAVLRHGAAWAGSAVVTVAVLYPALWAAPRQEIASMRRSAGMASDAHLNFFRGEVTAWSEMEFYGVALPFRMTPWFLGAAVVAVVAVAALRSTRAHGFVVLAMGAPALLIISLSAKQFDRYGLPILVCLALIVGMGAQAVRDRWHASAATTLDHTDGDDAVPTAPASARVPLLAAALGVALILAHSVAVAPWALAYFNPLLGNSTRVERTLLVGWGEGLRQANSLIEAHAAQTGEHADCGDVLISQDYGETLDFWPCGTFHGDWRTGENFVEPHDADYVVVYINRRQRWEADRIAWTVAGRELVGIVEARGFTLAEVYGPSD